MSRRLTSMLLMVTVIAYGFLYHIAYQVEELDKQRLTVERMITQEKENIHVLEAEWAYLNRPDYLQRINTQFALGPVAVKQMIPPAAVPQALTPDEAQKIEAVHAAKNNKGKPLNVAQPSVVKQVSTTPAKPGTVSKTAPATNAKPKKPEPTAAEILKEYTSPAQPIVYPANKGGGQ